MNGEPKTIPARPDDASILNPRVFDREMFLEYTDRYHRPEPITHDEWLRLHAPYEHLGNLSAVEPHASVTLRCHRCRVEWIGCFDAAACPRCGNHDDWDKLMAERGHYREAGL